MNDSTRIELEPGELWWGGAVPDGQAMPFGESSSHTRDLAVNAGLVDNPFDGANQSAPVLVSNRGRYVWSDHPFTFTFDGAGTLCVDGTDVVVGRAGDSLADAFRQAASAHFTPSGAAPDPVMFTAPQYNTWMEMPYRPTQSAVLAYAKQILDTGFPPGLLMIDDRWSVAYGNWAFDSSLFPDTQGMVEQLHDWGFRVMLWLVPFVSPDSEQFRLADSQGWLVTQGGEPVIRKWWNGYSAVPDLTNPGAVGWIRDQLLAMRRFGIDGFKFDAGDLRDYRLDDETAAGSGPTGQCEAWAKLAAAFGFNELRACWKMGGQPLAQRLHDKPCRWGEGGLGSLIPESIAQGLIGHPYNCPDMVGGGDVAYVLHDLPVDTELFVRSAQCSALFPMMQFSMSPRRVLNDREFAAVRAAVDLRQQLLPEILALVENAKRTGEPILRPLAYHHSGYEQVHDQFLLGEHLLVAPVLEAGATTRTVLLPPGRWQRDGYVVEDGPCRLTVEVTLETLPVWRRVGLVNPAVAERVGNQS